MDESEYWIDNDTVLSPNITEIDPSVTKVVRVMMKHTPLASGEVVAFFVGKEAEWYAKEFLSLYCEHDWKNDEIQDFLMALKQTCMKCKAQRNVNRVSTLMRDSRYD